MPREIAHGFIALRALELTKEIGSKTLPKPALLNAFLLGTCTPDSGYYCKSPLIKGEHISDLLHNSSAQDSFYLIKEILRDKNNKEDPLVEAFCLGYLSHIIIDSYFHPYIFKITGNYYHSDLKERTLARARHRKIETILDILIINNYQLSTNSFLMVDYLASIIEHARKLDLIMTNIIKVKPNSLKKAWWWHSQFQKIFRNQTLSKKSNSIPIRLEFKTLFSDFNEQIINHVEESVAKHFEKNFKDIISDCINILGILFKNYEENGDSFLKSEIGPSPNSGKVGVIYYDAEYEVDRLIIGD